MSDFSGENSNGSDNVPSHVNQTTFQNSKKTTGEEVNVRKKGLFNMPKYIKIELLAMKFPCKMDDCKCAGWKRDEEYRTYPLPSLEIPCLRFCCSHTLGEHEPLFCIVLVVSK